MDSKKSYPVTLQTFEGKDSEDFALFKEKIEEAFISNRVKNSDRFAKLRNCLKGQALNYMPDLNARTVEEVWADFEKAFGNPAKLMRRRKEAILKLGRIPRDNGGRGQPNYKAQAEWFLKLESLLRGAIYLGYKSNSMTMQAFYPPSSLLLSVSSKG